MLDRKNLFELAKVYNANELPLKELPVENEILFVANEEFDVAKAMMMALIHDIVEIDAGDTYAYGDAGKDSQQEREEKAAQRIFGLLPDEQRDELISLFYEFEACETAEARFA